MYINKKFYLVVNQLITNYFLLLYILGYFFRSFFADFEKNEKGG
jgi:hypothetical protein